MRDFSVADREVPGPRQTDLAAVAGSGGPAQDDRAAGAAEFVLRVLRPEETHDEHFPGHRQLAGGVRPVALREPANAGLQHE